MNILKLTIRTHADPTFHDIGILHERTFVVQEQTTTELDRCLTIMKREAWPFGYSEQDFYHSHEFLPKLSSQSKQKLAFSKLADNIELTEEIE